MKLGFKTYYKLGMHDTKMLLKKKSNFFKFFVYVIMSLLGTFIVPSITQVSVTRLSKSVHEDNNLSLLDAFSFGDKPLSIYHIILTGLLKVLILLTGIIACSLIGGLFYLLGSSISYLLFNDPLTSITYVLSGIGSISLLIFIYFYIFYLNHTNFLLSEENNLTPTKAIKTSMNLSKNGKLAMFLNFLMGLIIFLGFGIVYAGINFVIMDILPSYTPMPSYVITFIYLLVQVILSLVLVFVLPYAILPSMIASYLLRKDLCLGDKEHNYEYTNVSVNTSKLNKKYINVTNVETNLDSLFDNPSTPTEENPQKENNVSKSEEVNTDIENDSSLNDNFVDVSNEETALEIKEEE